jgi:hypothetical protein
MKVDRSLSPEIERIAQAITAGELISSVENAIAHKLS